MPATKYPNGRSPAYVVDSKVCAIWIWGGYYRYDPEGAPARCFINTLPADAGCRFREIGIGGQDAKA